jgi:hypothetical protein
MHADQEFEARLKEAWDHAAAEGRILHRTDTLTTRTIEANGTTLVLLHNACRDEYDRTVQARGVGADLPSLTRTDDPELLRVDETFVVRGNRFACVRYQSIMSPIEPITEVTQGFIRTSLDFANRHPGLMLMYNALGAGKTVSNQFWLLSLRAYDNLLRLLRQASAVAGLEHTATQISHEPCYTLNFATEPDVDLAATLIHELIAYMGNRNFNIFLHDKRAVFIPREDVEVPPGFGTHRFGGLEMIGCFVMKSADALQLADGPRLVDGIHAIRYRPEHQAVLEPWLHSRLRSLAC